jgi:hypothetical protein
MARAVLVTSIWCMQRLLKRVGREMVWMRRPVGFCRYSAAHHHSMFGGFDRLRAAARRIT